MTDEQVPVPAKTIGTIIESITKPQPLSTFYDSARKLSVILHRNAADAGKDIELPPIFPFFRVYDLKLAIFKHLKNNELAAGVRLYPEYQFLSFSQIAGTRRALDFQWFVPGRKVVMQLAKPFDTQKARRVAKEFVDENGTKRLLTLVDTSKILIENALKTNELHLYLYDDMKEWVGELSELKWNGFLRPYFPDLSYESEEIDKKKLEKRYQRFLNTTSLAENLNKLLTEELDIRFSGVRRLQMRWESTGRVDVESLFYTTPVTEARPYMRLIPNKGVAITKLHLQDDNTPDADLARVLKQWTRERNPNPENDYVMAKCVLKAGELQQNPIYATLRFGYSHKEEYADLTVLPPKGVRRLDTIFTETEKDGRKKRVLTQFEKGIDKLPYASVPIKLQSASLDYMIQLPAKPIFTKANLKARLAKFLPFFQEIPPLPGVQPIAMLRYKCVDNFTNEGRISSFLTQYANLKMVKGETDTAILSVLEDEFQLDTDTAQQALGNWLKSRGEVVLSAEGETVEANNTGIDIAIFAQHPFFSFHLHNVSSEENLQRVLNLLSILFTSSDESLHVSTKIAEKIKIVEEAAIQEEVAEAEAEAESEPTEDVGDDDFWKQFAATESEPLEEEVRNEYLLPKDEPINAPPVAAVAEVSAAPAADGKIIADFFLTKLKEADKNLFDYSKTHPSLKKYVSMCAANVTRQPAVMSRAQFLEMRDEIYEEDLNSDPPRIAFVEYPLQKDQKALPRPEQSYEEVFYFLRFGTTPQKKAENYYVCSRYYCARDELILLEKDFKGTKLRRPVLGEDGTERTTKDPNTCPFCEGKVVKNRRLPGINETVLVRLDAPKTQGGIFHKYIGFLKRTPHPEGFHLPCCFIDNDTVNEDDKYYDKFKDIRQTEVAAAAPAKEAEQQAPEVRKRDEPMFPQQPYITYMARAFTKYIVGSEKLPLEIDEIDGPQIGLLPPVLDEYFKQDISNFINPKTPHKLKPDAEGFLRIAVENRARFKTDSFLAAIAPFYMQRSAREMKALIKQSLQTQPSVFFQLNYGNFLLEYYDIHMKSPSTAFIQRWLEGADMNNWKDLIAGPKKTKVVKRFYMSYNSFMGWLDAEDGYKKGWIEKDDTMKEYRQIASLLAQPDFILRMPNMDDITEEGMRPGITFIVLDVDANGSLKVRCPPYGFNKSVHTNNDVAFLLHHHSGVWEPIFHVSKGRYNLFFQRGWKKDAEEISWPKIVKERKREFESLCLAEPTLSYATRQVGRKRLIPSSTLYYKLSANEEINFNGLLRDPYNHLTALVFKTAEGLIPVPCIDDGKIFPATTVYLDWGDLNPTASPKEILEFYEKYIVNESEFQSSNGDILYKPIQVWFQKDGDKARIFAILLRNNAILPVKRNMPITLVKEGNSYFYVKDQYKLEAVEKTSDELEWEINKQILGLSRSPLVIEEEEREATTLTMKEVSDIFEHLRITFAKWISKKGDTGEVRKELEEIIYGVDDRGVYKASLAEKRKELYAYLGPKIFSWFSDTDSEGRPTLQRVDCTSLDKGACSGRCVWNTKGAEGQCLIHTPKDKVVENLDVDIKYLLFFKLIEELLRFAEKRRELFDDDVSQTGTIDRRIQDGDQEILPENTAAWYERLRGEWVRSADESPRFFEEIASTQAEEVVPLDEDTMLPPPLETFLEKEDTNTSRMRLLRAPMRELLALIRAPIEPVDDMLSMEELDEIARATKLSVAQIDIRTDPPTSFFRQFKLKTFTSKYFILVITETGPAILLRDPATKELPIFTELPKQLQKYFILSERKVAGALLKRRTRKGKKSSSK